MLEVSLRASRREALEARRSRDSAETTVRQQSGALAKLQGRVSALEASLVKEQEAGKVRTNCCYVCSRVLSRTPSSSAARGFR